jgi:ribonuclease D
MNPHIDLESAIMVAWQTSEDIELLYKHHGDSPKPMTDDEVANALLGIKTLHDMRCEHLMDVYCQKLELNEYCTDPEKLEARYEMFNQTKKKAKKK